MKKKSFAFILISIIIFIPNFGGILIAKFVFGASDNNDSTPQIFYIICGMMILISLISFIYGMILLKRNK